MIYISSPPKIQGGEWDTNLSLETRSRNSPMRCDSGRYWQVDHEMYVTEISWREP